MEYVVLIEDRNHKSYQIHNFKYDSNNEIRYISFYPIFDNFFAEALKFNDNGKMFETIKSFLTNAVINDIGYSRLEISTLTIKELY